jgi:hypothetical protein
MRKLVSNGVKNLFGGGAVHAGVTFYWTDALATARAADFLIQQSVILPQGKKKMEGFVDDGVCDDGGNIYRAG